MTEKSNKILKKLEPHFQKFEIILVTIALARLALKTYHIFPAGNIILIASMGLLSVFYILSASLPVKLEREDATYGYTLFVNKLTGFSYAIIIVGILFSLQHWRPILKVIFMPEPVH